MSQNCKILNKFSGPVLAQDKMDGYKIGLVSYCAAYNSGTIFFVIHLQNSRDSVHFGRYKLFNLSHIIIWVSQLYTHELQSSLPISFVNIAIHLFYGEGGGSIMRHTYHRTA